MRRTWVTDATLVDTGFWIALFDPRDERHHFADENGDWLDLATVVMPWPVLYETLRTRFVRRPEWVVRLDKRLRRPRVAFHW
jgi:predicted nucleic acid-binding protein